MALTPKAQRIPTNQTGKYTVGTICYDRAVSSAWPGPLGKSAGGNRGRPPAHVRTAPKPSISSLEGLVGYVVDK